MTTKPTCLDLHRAALSRPTSPAELAFVRMYDAWRLYAQEYRRRYKARVGEDRYLGQAWADIGRALRDLLNGEVGPRIDCGTMDSTLRDYLTQEGVDPYEDAIPMPRQED